MPGRRPGRPEYPPMSAIRVLYSFPHRIGAGRICSTAYHQVCGLAGAGSSVTVLSGSAAKALPPGVRLLKTLALGDLRVPARIVGRGTTCAVHDWVTAKWLQRNGGNIDVVHCWPLASIRTLRVAKQLGIPTFIERPNTHTGSSESLCRGTTTTNSMVRISPRKRKNTRPRIICFVPPNSLPARFLIEATPGKKSAAITMVMIPRDSFPDLRMLTKTGVW